MLLLKHLESVSEKHESYVQRQLAKEDLERVAKLRDIARAHKELQSLKKEALFIGWTNGDLRTHELSEPLHVLIQAVHDFETNGGGEEYDAAIMTAWTVFHGLRMKILIHCL